MTRTLVLDFYDGTHPDHRGRYLEDILEFSDEQLETTHDYIQWLFPLNDTSLHMAYAPLLTHTDVSAFTTDPAVRINYGRAFEMMLAFYGFDITLTNIMPSTDHDKRLDAWVKPDSHHYLRISRMLHSLSMLGQNANARTFLRLLWKVALDNPDAVPEHTVRVWTRYVDINDAVPSHRF